MIYVWLAAFVVLIIAEAATYALVSIWFAAGALAGGIVCMLGGVLWLQLAAFIVVSAVVLAALRPVAKKYRSVKKVCTNADAVVGKAAVVTEEINNDLCRGEVSVMGKRWSARSVGGDVIPVGAKVKAERIEGVKLICEREERSVEI